MRSSEVKFHIYHQDEKIEWFWFEEDVDAYIEVRFQEEERESIKIKVTMPQYEAQMPYRDWKDKGRRTAWIKATKEGNQAEVRKIKKEVQRRRK